MAISYLLAMHTAFLLVGYSKANLCPNPHFCHTNEIKYISFKAMSKSYFNSTHVINSLPIKEEKMCLRQCTTSPKCQSINHYRKPSTDQMICDLIDANIYSNASQINQMENSTHYFIKSPCSSNPCKNAGTCIPLYQEGSYRCACTANNNTIWKYGQHCEILTVSEMTANIYYNFDQPAPFKDLKSTSGRTMTVSGNSKALNVPDRSSPVAYFAPVTGAAYGSNYGSECIVYPPACTHGLTVSLWYKLTKKSQDQFPGTSQCPTKYTHLMETPEQADSYYGTSIILRGCSTNAIQIKVRLYGTKFELLWGSAHDKQLFKTWSHLLFTFKDGVGIILYINGIEVARKTSYTSLSAARHTGSDLKLNNRNDGFEMFLDDFAAWYTVLNKDDVKTVFQEGLKRNQAAQFAKGQKNK